MDISKMKSLTQGMKNIKSGGNSTSNAAKKYGNEYLEYFNKGLEYCNNDDYKNALKFLPKAAEKIPAASFAIFGISSKLNQNDVAMQWLKKSADDGYPMGMYIYGSTIIDNNIEEAVNWIKKSAEAGFIDAMSNLVDAYFAGKVLPKNDSQAFSWAKKAAETTPTGNDIDRNYLEDDTLATANFKLGMCYFAGIGTAENPAEAFSLFKKAGELGSADAMFYIAEMYRKGIGVIANEKTADEWVKKGVDLGNPGSMISYANRLEEEYLDKLNNWNETSNQGDSFWNKLGRVVTFVGGAWLQMKITDLYKKAAELGNLDGYFHLGVFYFKKANSKHSFNEHADRKDAIYYLTKGVEGGHAGCMWILGMVYENIYNILDGKNDSEYQEKLKQARGSTNEERAANLALHWYEQAANNGVEEARQAYDEFSSKLRNRNSGGGGCFITTAVCENFGKPDDCYELTAFRNFRDNWLINQSDGKSLIEEYYKIAPNIVSKIDSLPSATQIYKKIWENYLAPCLNLIENGDNQSCKCLYIEMVNSLKKKFL